MTKFTVVGAGMAGLLAGAMLRSDCAAIVESQLSLPNNHSALLRFRSSIVGDVLGIEFKRVKVIKAVVPWQNPLADALAYSKKATGNFALRSSLSAKGELEERFIAPPDLIQKMADRVQADIQLGADFKFNQHIGGPIISTVPMPVLMKILGYPKTDEVQFKYQNGANINVELDQTNAYGTLYVPDPAYKFNRVSVTGSKLTIEFSGHSSDEIWPDVNSHLSLALEMLGMADANIIPDTLEAKDQRYSKILPINEALRKHFMIWATENHMVYSLGRFATWRPGLLLDDVVNDVRVIQRLVTNGHAYDHRKA